MLVTNGVTKIASRWGGGGAGHTLVVPLDITKVLNPAKCCWYTITVCREVPCYTLGVPLDIP